MHPCAALLNEVLSLVPSEEKALADEDVDRAEELAGQRAILMQKAWKTRDGYDEEALRRQLLLVQEAQTRLRNVAEKLHAQYRSQQRASRNQAKYLNTDRHIQAELQRAFYCDKKS